MALTPELVALCERPEADPGPDPRWTHLTHAAQDALGDALYEAGPGEPVWVFAYGSLIWKPGFEYAEARRALLRGWRRSFCLEIARWRGSPAQPVLMMALARGGACVGVAYRLPDGRGREGLRALVRREMDYEEDRGSARWATVETDRGPLRAVAFWVGPTGEGVRTDLSPEAVAAILARACGHVGSCAAYLRHTVDSLEAHGIHDRGLWRLQALVAAQIRARLRLTADDDADDPPR
jgi:cation transport protein ChaC